MHNSDYKLGVVAGDQIKLCPYRVTDVACAEARARLVPFNRNWVMRRDDNGVQLVVPRCNSTDTASHGSCHEISPEICPKGLKTPQKAKTKYQPQSDSLDSLSCENGQRAGREHGQVAECWENWHIDIPRLLGRGKELEYIHNHDNASTANNRQDIVLHPFRGSLLEDLPAEVRCRSRGFLVLQ